MSDTDNEDDIFNGWMADATSRRVEVPIYGNMPLLAEIVEAEARLEELKKSKPATQLISQRDPVRELDEQIEAMYERLAPSRSVWTVRALTVAEARQVANKFPVPIAPKSIGPDATDAQVEKYEERFQKFRHAAEVAEEERNLRFVHHGVVKIVTPKGEKSGIALEQLRAMYEGEYGRQRLTLLLNAVNKATTGEVAIERPTLPGESGSDRASS